MKLVREHQRLGRLLGSRLRYIYHFKRWGGENWEHIGVIVLADGHCVVNIARYRPPKTTTKAAVHAARGMQREARRRGLYLTARAPLPYNAKLGFRLCVGRALQGAAILVGVLSPDRPDGTLRIMHIDSKFWLDSELGPREVRAIILDQLEINEEAEFAKAVLAGYITPHAVLAAQ